MESGCAQVNAPEILNYSYLTSYIGPVSLKWDVLACEHPRHLIDCYLRAHLLELLEGGGEAEVLVVGDDLERVGAALHGLGPAVRLRGRGRGRGRGAGRGGRATAGQYCNEREMG